MASNIFENVWNTVSNLKKKAQTGIQNWATQNPQTAQRIINAPQQYTNAYAKASQYVPFAPKLSTPQQIQKNYQPVKTFVNQQINKPVIGPQVSYNPITPKNIYNTGKSIVKGTSEALLYNPKNKRIFPSSPYYQMPDANKLKQAVQKRDFASVGKLYEPLERSTMLGFTMGGPQSKGQLLGADIKEIGSIANRASKRWFNQTGKVDLTQMAKDESLVDTILGNKYKAPVSELKKIPLEKKINTLFGIAMEDYRGAPKIQPGMSTKELKGAVQVGKDIPKVEQNPVQKIISALGEAKPLRSKQEALYSAERGSRVAQAELAGKVGGEKGYFAQLGKLKGELPKVNFESIRKLVTQPDIDSLFNTVESAPLTTFEKINAKTGLSKLLGAEGGKLPTEGEIKLLSEVFPKEFIQAIQNKRPFMEKLFAEGVDALNLPRSIMATADMSAPLRQGVFLIGRPKQWLPAFRDMFKYAFSEKAYQGADKIMKADPFYKVARENKLSLTGIGELSNREETFMSTLAEKIPGFGAITKGSNRAYSGFLNKLRFDTFKDLLGNAKKLGISDNPKTVNDIAKFVNYATGRGDIKGLEGASKILNATFFSPRLMSSRIGLLNPAFYAKLDPFVRKEALKSLFTFAGTGLTALTLAKLGGAEVGTDPRSSDFGKIKVGNTRYDIWGGFQQYIKLASQLITGQMVSSTTGKEYNLGEGYKPTTRADVLTRFFESKESPIASFVTQLFKGQNAMGEPFNASSELVSRFIPMVVQDMYDVAKDRNSPLASLMSLPNVFGVGSQTYGKQYPKIETTPSGKTKVSLKQETGLAEDIVNKVKGTPKTNIPNELQSKVVESATKVKDISTFKEKLKTLSLVERLPYVKESLANGTITKEDLSKILKGKSTGTSESVSIEFIKNRPAQEKITYLRSLTAGKTPDEKLAIVKNLLKKKVITLDDLSQIKK